jgi:purine nucleosidase
MQTAIATCVSWVLLISTALATTVWIDTDPAIGSPIREVDDGFALVLAFHSPELRIAGISTTYGNASLEQTTRVARAVTTRFGREVGLSVEHVYAGAPSPGGLGEQTAATAALVGATGMEKLTYVALGPLTNLAAALQTQPEIARQIERAIIVGGRSPGAQLQFGLWLRIHDANVLKDPQAVRVVLASKIPITIVPPQSAVSLNAADLRQLRGTSASADFLYANTRTWLWFWTTVARRREAPVFDAGAVLVAADPLLAVRHRANAVLTSAGELTGSSSAGRPVTWCSGFKPEAKSLLLRRLRERVK